MTTRATPTTSPAPASASRPVPSLVYGAAFGLGATLVLWGALAHAATDQRLGDIQRIFYYHVPSAMNAGIAFVVAGVSGIAYLVRRRAAWDTVGRAATGLGVMWATVVLITGPIWARSSWGAWWTWEARLTTSLIVWLMFLGALLVRRVSHDPEQGARLGAVIQIIGMINLPIIYFSVHWWRGMHPVVFGKSGGGLADPSMKLAFGLGMVGVLLMHAALYGLALRVARAQDDVAALERRIDEEGGLR